MVGSSSSSDTARMRVVCNQIRSRRHAAGVNSGLWSRTAASLVVHTRWGEAFYTFHWQTTRKIRKFSLQLSRPCAVSFGTNAVKGDQRDGNKSHHSTIVSARRQLARP
jgi:hypothetical protein